MIISYQECLEKYNSDYNLKNALREECIYKIEKGVYSDKKSEPEVAIIAAKYKSAVFTMDSAFYYHGLTDSVPEKYHLATKKSARGIRDNRVKQVFVPENIFALGIEGIERRGVTINIYDKERMLVELLRYKNIMPYDLYKEILNNYRETIYDLDLRRIEEYIKAFPKSKMIMKAYESEVL